MENIEADRDLSDTWEQVSGDSQCWMKNLQTDILGLGERLTKKQTTSKPDYLWPETMDKRVTCSETNTKKHKWAIEKPKLDNASRLRGIHFIDPADAEFKETTEKCTENVGISDASSYALQDQENRVQGDLYHS